MRAIDSNPTADPPGALRTVHSGDFGRGQRPTDGNEEGQSMDARHAVERSHHRFDRLGRLVRQALWLTLLPGAALAYESGSTGADGAFNPTIHTRVPLPPDGVLHYTDVNIPSGVNVTFERNAANTPVVILASGNVTVAGAIHVSGGWSTNAGAAGDANPGDDGIPGVGGPGGYDGGRGGPKAADFSSRGGAGLGPGGGAGGFVDTNGGTNQCRCTVGGSGGGHGSAGTPGSWWTKIGYHHSGMPYGSTYGTPLLQPLVGGSGGGGGAGGSFFGGAGGGGGGGALLIAASGTVNITGAIYASGGGSGAVSGMNVGAAGGTGSGGSIRIVATEIAGQGTISATAPAPRPGYSTSGETYYASAGGTGGVGRIRLESEILTRTAATTPMYSYGDPAPAFIAGLPGLRITTVAGVAVPANPTGSGDVVLPADTPNPVTVAFETSGVPVGNTVKLTVTPASGATTSVVSPALVGTTESASASVSVNLPGGPSTLLAQTSYTLLAAAGNALAPYAGGEQVAEVQLDSSLQGGSTVTLITVSGKTFTYPSSRIAAMPVS